ncbi:MAG TPA: YHYH protein, partial [Bacteroidia bacterium]
NGPPVNSSYPAGCFIEDYIYTANSGDLDQRNGRFCVTPEYPNGTYAYFVTLDGQLNPAFPYTFYGTYYGVVQAGNTGPNSGHNTITESTSTYTPTGISESNSEIKFQVSQNPTTDLTFIYFEPESPNNITGELYDSKGRLVQTITNMQPTISYTLDLTAYPAGIYFLRMKAGEQGAVAKIVKLK